jgi:predicted permease
MLIRDVARQFARRPGLTIVLIALIGTGAGIATAALSAVHPITVSRLPYSSDHLVVIRARQLSPVDDARLNVADYGFWRDNPPADLIAIAGYSSGPGFHSGDGPRRSSAYVTPGFLELFDGAAARGRLFEAGEFAAASPSCVISHALWVGTLGGDERIIGRSVTLTSLRPLTCTVVGVLSKQWVFPIADAPPPDVFLPMPISSADHIGTVRGQLLLFGHLRGGDSLASVTSTLQAGAQSAERTYRRLRQGRTVELLPLRQALYGPYHGSAQLVSLAVIALLLITTFNAAHLYSASLRRRAADFRIRTCIGMTQERLGRLLTAELAAVWVVAIALAFGVGLWLTIRLRGDAPLSLHVFARSADGSMSRLGLYALATTALSVCLCGGVPALQALREYSRSVLTLGPQYNDRDARRRWTDSLLVAGQIAFSLLIVTTASSALGSAYLAQSQPIGFEYAALRVLQPEPPAEYLLQKTDDLRTINESIYRRLISDHRVPVAMSIGFPAMGSAGTVTGTSDVSAMRVPSILVTSTFFDVVGVRFLEGGDVTGFDRGEPIAVLDQTAANALSPGQSAVGATIRDDGGVTRTVVGVVSAIGRDLLGKVKPTGYAFLPIGENTGDLVLFSYQGNSGNEEQIRAVVRDTLPGVYVPPQALQPFGTVLTRQRFFGALFGAAGAVAIALMMLGVLGVTVHYIVARSRELAIRSALGARPISVITVVVGRTVLLPCLAGIVVGAIAAVWSTAAMKTMWFNGQAFDLRILGLAAGLVMTAAIGAALAPAIRASRQPIAATIREVP